MKYIMMLFLLLINCNLSIADGFKDYIYKAYENSETLKAQLQMLKSKNIGEKKAVLNFLPKLNLDINNISADQKDGPLMTRTKTRKRDLTLSQNLFKGGADIINLNIAKYNTKIAQLTFTEAEQNVILDAISSYINYMLADESYKVSLASENILAKHLESTNLRFELGEVTKTDVAQAKARFSASTANKIKYKGERDSQYNNFIKVFGTTPENLTKPNVSKLLPSSFEEALKIAKLHNTQLLISELNYQAAKEGLKLAFSRLSPNVNLQGNIGKVASSNIANKQREKSLLLSVNIPIFQNGSEYLNISDSRYNEERMKHIYNQVLRNVSNEVKTAWIEFHTSKASISSAKDTVDSAVLAYEGINEEAKIGLKTTLDVLNAEQELFNAKLQLLNAEYQSIKASYKLLAVIGKLHIDDM